MERNHQATSGYVWLFRVVKSTFKRQERRTRMIFSNTVLEHSFPCPLPFITTSSHDMKVLLDVVSPDPVD